MKFTLDWRELVVRVVQGFLNNPQNITAIKVLMEGKLIAVRILCVHIETSSLWTEFVNMNRCIRVSLVFEEVKSI